MRVARDKGMGHCFFRSRFFTDNTKGLYQLVAEDIDAYPALVPPMRQATLLASPPSPLVLNLERYGDFDNLSWPNNGEVNGSYARYNIYRSNHWPVDITDPRNMIATYSTQCLITIPHAKGARYHYAVTTIDRYGQESTAAVLWHGDFYKAAYSACGCHDNRMDKIWWNEQWMGYPVDSAYVECSNVANAALLTRPLMLVVGELDDNVDPASTMQLANALIKAGKNFELVVIPGAHHTMGEAFGEHKRFDFFVKNLLKVDPPKWE